MEDFVGGFRQYAQFLGTITGAPSEFVLDDFRGLPVRKVLRPTQFYSMLLGRLQDDRTMDDGIVWSAQTEFVARFADWDTDSDPM